jgi:hypothetical protein
MLEIVVCLEKGIAGEELHQDTPNTPYIAREAPSQIQDDLGGSVVAGGNDRGMVLVIKCRGTKVNQANLAVKKDTPLPGVPGVRVGGGGNGTVIGKGLVCIADEEDIFGLEVGMDEVEVVKDLGGSAEITTNVWSGSNSQATLVNNWRANCWI